MSESDYTEKKWTDRVENRSVHLVCGGKLLAGAQIVDQLINRPFSSQIDLRYAEL